MKTADASGAVVNAYSYDVYGKTTASSGSQANDFQFAGQQTDPTGLQYLRARYYDPEMGGFQSRDPMAAGPKWADNPLRYAQGNPVANEDPSGLRCAFGVCVDRDGPSVPGHEVTQGVRNAVPYDQQCAAWGAAGAVTGTVIGGPHGTVIGATVGCITGMVSHGVDEADFIPNGAKPFVQCGVWALGAIASNGGAFATGAACGAGFFGDLNGSYGDQQCRIWGLAGLLAGTEAVLREPTGILRDWSILLTGSLSSCLAATSTSEKSHAPVRN